VLASAGEPVAGAERKTGPEGGEAMIHGDATAAALAAVLDEEEAAEDRAARAGHALAELEERAEEGPAAAVGLEACRRWLAAAEEWLAEVRRKRRDLETRLDEREALRVHAGRCGRAPDAR
jgi:hypothetical protein